MIDFTMPADEYHDDSRLGIHALLDFEERGPSYFYKRHVTREIEGTVTEAMQIGSMTHALILEGEEALKQMCITRPPVYMSDAKMTLKEAQKQGWIDKDRKLLRPLDAQHIQKEDGYIYKVEQKPWNNNSNTCKEWMDEQLEKGLIVTTEAVKDRLRAMRDSVHENDECARLLEDGSAEVTIRRPTASLPTQIRMDWLIMDDEDPIEWHGMVDLKTIRDLNLWGEKEIRARKYHRQAAWYQYITYEETGIWLPWKFIVVETQEPYRCGVSELSPDLLEEGHEANLDLIDAVNKCWEADSWPRADLPVGHMVG